ncbi:hypothetical protein Lal_00020903 [Lupinus albus]|nr:hypothetical protein Lal_00020903 [Lupinus albus]
MVNRSTNSNILSSASRFRVRKFSPSAITLYTLFIFAFSIFLFFFYLRNLILVQDQDSPTLPSFSLQSRSHQVPELHVYDKQLWDSPFSHGLRSCVKPTSKYKGAQGFDRYLTVRSNGGLNQMRTGISDMVAVAYIMNATLVIPQLDKRSFWQDTSVFSDIFDELHFIESLRGDIRVVKELPKNLEAVPRARKHFTSWSSVGYYREMTSLWNEYQVIHVAKSDSRLANNDLPLDIQRLRCRAMYRALQFSPPIENLGKRLVDRLRSRGERYIALHLRYEKDMLSFTGCTYGLTDAESEELRILRENTNHWKVKDIDSTEQRLGGFCPLTPKEVGIFLQALGFPPSTSIYIAAGEIYGGNTHLSELSSRFPNLIFKESLASPEELKAFINHASQSAALDYIISVESDVFVPSYSGNMARAVEGHRRFLGHRKTINPDRKGLVENFDKLVTGELEEGVTLSHLVQRMHKNRQGAPRKRHGSLPGLKGKARLRTEESFYENPYPECICSSDTPVSNNEEEGEDVEASQLFEKLKEAERKRINELEELDNKANVQLERQLVMASSWSRALLTLRGKLKGTEWDPENSHRIDFSDFLRLLDSNNVQFMEYSNYGQTISVILPYYKNGKTSGSEGNSKDIVFRRHPVDRMPIDSWNDVWGKLHQQIVNVDVINVDSVPAEVYSTVATAVIWSMRLALAVGFYVWIDNLMRPIYAKLIPCDLGTPTQETRLPLKRQSLGSLGKSRAKFISAEERTGVTFDDFAGQEYIKRELLEIVRILKNDEEFQDQGIYSPKGVLLHGPPGTGKTLLAKAIAGEAGLPFFAANGTDFVEMFVGVAASRVKDLFANARSFAPSIIFIDEIDAIGSKRGGPDIGGGGAEREQGLLQILTELDGFKVSTAQVLVIGATNRLDILDPALLRKGRFDKIIRVGLPSKDGRFAILKVHARNKYFRSEEEKDILLKEIAELTEDFTGAELQNILNEAGILTARKDLDYIGRDELHEALKRQKGTFETGQEDSTAIPEDLKLRLAYREAAVAVLACYFPEPHRPFVETDINSIRSQPNMRYTEISGQVFARKLDYINSIVRACAPRVIEEEMFGIDNLCWISAKATLEASRRAEFLILQTGMTAFGKAYYKNHSDLVPNLVMKLEALRDEYMRYATEKCSSVLNEYQSAVETITDILLEKGEIKAEEIWEIYKNSPRLAQPSVSPLDEYGALIYAGRWGIHGISLPGRVTFAPGNVGFSTFGAPRPTETQIVSDETWKLVDHIWDKKLEDIREDASRVIEEEKQKPQLLMASHFL